MITSARTAAATRTTFSSARQTRRNITSDAPNDGVGGIKFKPLNCDDEDMVDYQSVSYILKRLAPAA